MDRNRMTMAEQVAAETWERTRAFRRGVFGALALIVYAVIVRFV